MKGVSVNKLRSIVESILDKVDALLTTEPVRLIGYSAAAVVFLAAQLIGHFKPGLLPAVTFDEALGLSAAAVTTLVVLVESFRRFVVSPQTYIENLSDEANAAHEAAHIEEEVAYIRRAIREQQAQAIEDAQPKTHTVNVGSAKAAGTGDKAN